MQEIIITDYENAKQTPGQPSYKPPLFTKNAFNNLVKDADRYESRRASRDIDDLSYVVEENTLDSKDQVRIIKYYWSSM